MPKRYKGGNPHIKVKWVKKPAQFIQGVKRTFYNREVRAAFKEHGKPFLFTMKATVPKRSKRLWKNLGWIVKTYRGNATTLLIAGAKSNKPFTVRIRTRGKYKGKPFIDNTARRIHFSERKTHFIQRSMESNRNMFYNQVKRTLAESLKKYEKVTK